MIALCLSMEPFISNDRSAYQNPGFQTGAMNHCSRVSATDLKDHQVSTSLTGTEWYQPCKRSKSHPRLLQSKVNFLPITSSASNPIAGKIQSSGFRVELELG